MALGGEAAPAPFQSGGFCVACRHLAIAQIDRPFLASPFMQAELARAAHMFLDPQEPGLGPLIYLGAVADYPVLDGEICDRWAGLAGEAIYHVHLQREVAFADDAAPMSPAGDAATGRATLVLASPSRYWSAIAQRSFRTYFGQCERFCVNPFPGLTDIAADLPAPRLAAEAAFLRQAAGGDKVRNGSLGQDHSQRFLTKLALGMGEALFGGRFIATRLARRLRRGFWQQKPQAVAFFHAPAGFGLAGTWCLCLAVREDVLGLSIVTPAGKTLNIAIADEPDLWRGAEHEDLRDGVVYIAIPQREIFTQGLPLRACLDHCAGSGLNPVLSGLEALRTNPRHLPSKQGYA